MKTARCWVGIAVAAALLLSCGGHHREPSPSLPQVEGSHAAAPPASLEAALAELDALPVPDEVDAALFSELKEALAEALCDAVGARHAVPLREKKALLERVGRGFIPAEGAARLKSRPTQSSPTTNNQQLTMRRIASKPPTGEGNRVNDLSATGATATTVDLFWHYVNIGDYNQDGLVGIQDITPLAVHFGEIRHEIGGWPSPVDEVIDGNSDGAITILDITPLAAHFFATCEGYEVQGKVGAADEFARISEIGLNEAQGSGRLSFSATVERAGCVFLRVVPFDAYGELGEPSNEVQVDTSPPEISDVSPLGGVTGAEVQFTCSVSGAQPMTYAWDFGGGAEPNNAQTRTPTVTLGDVGEYPASLTATNAFGEDTFDFTLTVAPVEPVIQDVTPKGGPSGAEVTFTVSLTGSEPFTFFWGFGGGAAPNTPETSELEVTVTLGAEGTYPASVRAENSAGEDTLDFLLTVTAPMEPPDITDVQPQSGVESADVTFTATVTGDEPITYYWDFGGGATPDTSQTTEPEVTVELLAPDDYEASVTAQNAAGSDTFDFTLEVTAAGTGFKVVVVEEAAEHPSMTLVQGNPAIVFTRLADGADSVCYVRALDALGSEWGAYQQYMVSNATFTNNLLRIVDGRPAGVTSIGFMIEGGRIDFASAQDPAGDTWNSPVTVYDKFQIGPTAPGLLDVMGYPALAFSNDDYGGNTKLLYVRANNADGTDWPDTYVEVASVDSPSSAESSMVFADGYPAILHTWRLGGVYVRAKDEFGSEWSEPVKMDMANHSCMTLIHHNPAVAWITGGEGPFELRYRQAKDPAGSQWNDSVRVSEEGVDVMPAQGRICLAEINGRPAIAFRHSTLYFWCPAKYAVAKDEEGKEWCDPIEIEPDTEAGISLAEVAGRPAIAYAPWGGQELIYIRADDEFGLDWPNG